MATHIRPLELEVLCSRLQADFGAAIQGQGANDAERQRNFYSRALPAFVLTRQASATSEQAAAAIIDGGFDHGVDAVFVGADLTVWVLQSKYIDAGIGEPELGDVHKFCTGVRDLLRGQWARFNAALQAKAAELRRALDNETCRVQAILVHTGGAIADDRRVLLGDLETDFNAPRDDFVRTHAYGLSALHDLHLDGLAPAPIAAEFELRDFGFVAQPCQALYGRLSAQRLAELGQQHGDALVERNLRRFKGSTSVNEGLTATLREHADHFFYFNNGVTFLCESFNELHPRDDRRRQGRFNVRGLSIINGAQTVGAIAREPIAHYAGHGTLRAADVLREGRWLALHMLFIKTGLRRGAELNLSDTERERISRAVDAIAQAMVIAAQGRAWGKQARAVFGNRGDCATVKAVVMQAIPQAL